MKQCVDCKREFDPRDSLMGGEGQCQECWEEVCNKSWWALMKRLDILDGRKFEDQERPE